MDTVSTSVSTVRQIQIHDSSQTSSPRSSSLPSPPDSPSSDSSSFPSLSSSFFFSSTPDSPPNSHSIPLSDKDSAQGLIIPSLTLPSALRRPTPYGQTLGDLRLIVLAPDDVGKAFSSNILLDDNEDILEVGTWEVSPSGYSVLKASTRWIKHHNSHGHEKFEPARNVEIYDVPMCESDNVRFQYILVAGRVLITCWCLSGATPVANHLFDGAISIPHRIRCPRAKHGRFTSLYRLIGIAHHTVIHCSHLALT
jgi:hypothetical protein